MSTLFIMVGIPGSGKSFVANAFSKTVTSVVVSRDSIRYNLLKEGDKYFSKEKQVFAAYIKEIQKHLDKGEVVFADATHLNEASRRKLISNLKLAKEDYVVPMVIETPLEICLERNARRIGRQRVPESVIKDMFESLTDPADDSPEMVERYNDILYMNNKEEHDDIFYG